MSTDRLRDQIACLTDLWAQFSFTYQNRWITGITQAWTLFHCHPSSGPDLSIYLPAMHTAHHACWFHPLEGFTPERPKHKPGPA